MKRVTSRWGYVLWRMAVITAAIGAAACTVIYEVTDLLTWIFTRTACFLGAASEVRVEFFDPECPIGNFPGRDDSHLAHSRFRVFSDGQAMVNDDPGTSSVVTCPSQPVRPTFLRNVSRTATPTVYHGQNSRISGPTEARPSIFVEEIPRDEEETERYTFHTPPSVSLDTCVNTVDPFTTPPRTPTVIVPSSCDLAALEPNSPRRYSLRARRMRE